MHRSKSGPLMSGNGMVRPCSGLASKRSWQGAPKTRLSRKLQMLGHDARLMPAKYVRPYSKGQKNDFRDAERWLACLLMARQQPP